MNHEDSVKDSLRSPVIPQKEFKSLLDSEKSGALLKIRPKRLISHSDPPNLIGGRGPAKPSFEAFVQCREAAKFLGLHCKTVERLRTPGLTARPSCHRSSPKAVALLDFRTGRLVALQSNLDMPSVFAREIGGSFAADTIPTRHSGRKSPC